MSRRRGRRSNEARDDSDRAREGGEEGGDEIGRSDDLTDREREILRALGKGERDKEISARMEISIDTVRTHVRNAMRSLGARTREHAIALFNARGRS